MRNLLILELLIVIAARECIAWLRDVDAFAANVPAVPVLGYAYLQFLVVLALIVWLKVRGASLADYGFRNFGTP